MVQFVKKSLSVQIGLALALLLVISSVVSILVQSNLSKTFFESQFEVNSEETTLLLASQMLGGVKWKKSDAVADVLKKQISGENKQSNLSDAIVVTQDGKELLNYRAAHLMASDASVILEKNKAALADKEYITIHAEKHVISTVKLVDSKNDSVIGYVVMAWSKEAAQKQISSMIISSAITSVVVAMAIIGCVMLVLNFTAIKPIRSIETSMRNLVDGDTEADIPYINKVDEIGSIARSVQVFKENAIEKMRLEDVSKQQAVLAEQEKKQAQLQLAKKFQDRVQYIIEELTSDSDTLVVSAKKMSEAVQEASQSVEMATKDAEQNNQDIQSVAAASEEMSVTAQDISEQISHSNSRINESVTAVNGADEHMQELSAASEKVKEVTKIISAISNQINLLALNATIESARAGEAGRGFAVVAGEIKNLANQTDRSIQEIEGVIDEMNGAFGNVIGSLNTIKESVNSISMSSSSMAAVIEEQSATTSSISQNMQTSSVRTQSITENLRQVASSTSETQTTTHTLFESCQKLADQAKSLDKEVNSFLDEIMTAA